MNKHELFDFIRRQRSFLCVGLDTDVKKLPACLQEEYIAKGQTAEGIFAFNRAIVDATAPYCVAYKPNLAFYECFGLAGWTALEETVRYIRANHPEHFLIADAKRGDIGNTSAMYARALLESLPFDAITVAPYMGEDSVQPFLQYEGKWVVLLALTSNKGSHDFQMEEGRDGQRLFERVLSKSQAWGSDEQLMYVVGATQGRLFEDVRRLAPRHFLLVPGVGAQGGSLEEVCQYGLTDECGLLVNSSRAIIYASGESDFAQVAGEKAREVQTAMERILQTRGLI